MLLEVLDADGRVVRQWENGEHEDDDQDGFPDNEEIVCGSNPLDADSTPENEHQEVMAKSAILRRALEIAEGGL